MTDRALRRCIGLAGPRVAQIADLSVMLREALADQPAEVLSVYEYPLVSAAPLWIDRPEQVDLPAFEAALRSAIARVDPATPVIAVLGPLSMNAAVRRLCDRLVFIEVDEGLRLLRWVDQLISTAGIGGVEAIELFSREIEPAYQLWATPSKQLADIVLEDAEGLMIVASKIMYFWNTVDKLGGTERPAPRSQANVAAAPIAEAERLERLLNRKAPIGYFRHRIRLVFSGVLYPNLKRAFDILVVSVVLMVTWPVFVLVAMLIWIDDPGPFFFVQQRVGKHGQIIRFPKFRTMVQNAEALKAKLLAQNEMQGGITFKMKRDPRVLRIGRVLRKYSLDEIPQLWSVLRGQLSLVGPRPPVPKEVALYTARDRRRLDVVPGLTCIWQVSGRSDIPFARQVELDVEYIERRSFMLDIRLLAATIPAVVTGKGAY